MTIDGGMRMPSAPEVVMTPAPNRLGKPCATIAGRMIEPIATTVAGDEPEIAANNAQAMHAGEAQPAVPMSDHGGRERDHPPGHAAVGQEVAGQDEERDRHDLEVLDAGEQLQRHRLDRHVGHAQTGSQHREAERDRDRHAGQHQYDQQAEDDGRGHRAAPFTGLCAGDGSISMPSTWPSSWWGRSPVFQNVQATCRNRKHIR